MKLKCGCIINAGFDAYVEFCSLHEAAPILKETNYTLAVLSLQSVHYHNDPEFRDAVDNALTADKLAKGKA